MALGAAAWREEREAARAWHRQLGWHVFFFDEKNTKSPRRYLNVVDAVLKKGDYLVLVSYSCDSV